jgi:hypothetical protein
VKETVPPEAYLGTSSSRIYQKLSVALHISEEVSLEGPNPTFNIHVSAVRGSIMVLPEWQKEEYNNGSYSASARKAYAAHEKQQH